MTSTQLPEFDNNSLEELSRSAEAFRQSPLCRFFKQNLLLGKRQLQSLLSSEEEEKEIRKLQGRIFQIDKSISQLESHSIREMLKLTTDLQKIYG